MTRPQIEGGRVAQWDGVTDREAYKETFLAERDRLADAAHRGDWAGVLAAVAEAPGLANGRRIGGRSGWAPLHQAAWHGAPAEVVEQLVAAGAWRTLRSADGERPVDVAVRHGREALVPLLEPAPVHPAPERALRAMEHFLHALVRVRTEEAAVTTALLPMQVSVLTEVPDAALWFAVPGMYGGFSVRLEDAATTPWLTIKSHCRVVGGSGQTHRITPDGCALVEEGWG
ncbi:ankyrin repeat domain-containing protein [Kitasatospora aureofaciens]|uniref:ankyrin repeat domain-containing protein n=1 Tax=Kitasatospora aureofaciens TaxID=1894 RepID=UPI001C47BDF4|nr:ankyrin repeat domain-containing protein [Kitasatospora aureofaciens]MBV6700201.1 ankyrin repeat domain-containing protein [Kitasatospora aureofaciens]